MTGKPAIPFPMKMAWRESRSSWSRFTFFLLCIALGIGAIVGVGLFSASVERVILGDARALLGGDLEISLRRRLSETGQGLISTLPTRRIEVSHVTELTGMAAVHAGKGPTEPQTGKTQLVEIKAVDASYPLYGALAVEPPQSLPSLLAPIPDCSRSPCHGLVVQESLLIRLGLTQDSELQLGQALFKVTGRLLKEPDRVASAFSLGPRVIMSREGLKSTQLVQRGSRLRERYLLRLPSDLSPEPLVGEFRARLAREGARVVPYQDAQPRIRRFLDQLSTYLGLIGLTVLYVGGIGVACTIHGFLSSKTTIIAVLKALGADSRTILLTYGLQSLLMGGVGSLIGVGLGIGIQTLLPSLLVGLIPPDFPSHLSPGPIFNGIVLGLSSTMLFTLWPLLGIRRVSPALVFRRDLSPPWFPATTMSPRGRGERSIRRMVQDLPRVLTGLVMVLLLAGLSVWQARSLTLGGVFMAWVIAAMGCLIAGAVGFLRLTRLLPLSRPFLLRQALRNLRRPGNFTIGMSMAIGMGVMVIVGLASMKNSLLAELDHRIPSHAPSFFFIDIQPDQRGPFERLLRKWIDESAFRLTPVVRSRLTAIDGRAIDPAAYQDRPDGWYFTREYVLTALADLPEDNVIVDGEWWDPDQPVSLSIPASNPAGMVGVSIEQEAATHLGISVGSILEFDIQGTTLLAKTLSTRKVDWSTFSTNFFMILSPGALESAPMTFIATARVGREQEIPLQQELVSRLPNVTAINVGDVLDNVATLLKQLARAIQGLAFFCLLNGILVLTAALSTTRYRRIYEAAILKALGATRQVIARSFAVEFGLLGGAAGLIGLVLANLLAWLVLETFLDLEWTFDPTLASLALLSTIGFTLVIGFGLTFRLLRLPPLSVLRQD